MSPYQYHRGATAKPWRGVPCIGQAMEWTSSTVLAGQCLLRRRLPLLPRSSASRAAQYWPAGKTFQGYFVGHVGAHCFLSEI